MGAELKKQKELQQLKQRQGIVSSFKNKDCFDSEGKESGFDLQQRRNQRQKQNGFNNEVKNDSNNRSNNTSEHEAFVRSTTAISNQNQYLSNSIKEPLPSLLSQQNSQQSQSPAKIKKISFFEQEMLRQQQYKKQLNSLSSNNQQKRRQWTLQSQRQQQFQRERQHQKQKQKLPQQQQQKQKLKQQQKQLLQRLKRQRQLKEIQRLRQRQRERKKRWQQQNQNEIQKNNQKQKQKKRQKQMQFSNKSELQKQMYMQIQKQQSIKFQLQKQKQKQKQRQKQRQKQKQRQRQRQFLKKQKPKEPIIICISEDESQNENEDYIRNNNNNYYKGQKMDNEHNEQEQDYNKVKYEDFNVNPVESENYNKKKNQAKIQQTYYEKKSIHNNNNNSNLLNNIKHENQNQSSSASISMSNTLIKQSALNTFNKFNKFNNLNKFNSQQSPNQIKYQIPNSFQIPGQFIIPTHYKHPNELKKQRKNSAEKMINQSKKMYENQYKTPDGQQIWQQMDLQNMEQSQQLQEKFYQTFLGGENPLNNGQGEDYNDDAQEEMFRENQLKPQVKLEQINHMFYQEEEKLQKNKKHTKKSQDSLNFPKEVQKVNVNLIVKKQQNNPVNKKDQRTVSTMMRQLQQQSQHGQSSQESQNQVNINQQQPIKKKKRVFYKKLKNGVKIPIYKYVQQKPKKTYSKRRLQQILTKDVQTTIQQNMKNYQNYDDKQQLKSKKSGIYYKDCSNNDQDQYQYGNSNRNLSVPLTNSSFQKKMILTQVEQLFNLNKIYSNSSNYTKYNKNFNIVGEKDHFHQFYKLADIEIFIQKQMYLYCFDLLQKSDTKKDIEELLSQHIKIQYNINTREKHNLKLEKTQNIKQESKQSSKQKLDTDYQTKIKKQITENMANKNKDLQRFIKNKVKKEQLQQQYQLISAQIIYICKLNSDSDNDSKLVTKNSNLLEENRNLSHFFMILKELLDLKLIKIQVINLKQLHNTRLLSTSNQNLSPGGINPQQDHKYVAINRIYLDYVQYHKLYSQKMIDKYLKLLQNKQNPSPNKNKNNFQKKLVNLGFQFQNQQSEQVSEIVQAFQKIRKIQNSFNYSNYQKTWETVEDLRVKFRSNQSKNQYNIMAEMIDEKMQAKVQQSAQKILAQNLKSSQNIQISAQISNPRINQFDMETEVGKYFDLNEGQIQGSNASIFFNGTLKKYQKLALAWMLHREQCPIYYNYEQPIYHYDWLKINKTSDKSLYHHRRSSYIRPNLPKFPKFVKGGILADEMGLGKTIMSVALIGTHMRKPQKISDHNPRNLIKAGTLIVVPTSILGQWQTKIRQYLPHFRLFVFYHKNRHRHYKWIQGNQIVLTTQAILKIQRTKLKKQGNSKVIHGHSLYHYQWLRVIIDQAHNLRNPDCVYFKSLKQLTAQYRWCLSGTPLQNRLADLHPLLSFLQYSPWDQFQTWKRQFKSTKIPFSQARLQQLKSIMKGILVRRKKQSVDSHGDHLVPLKPYKSLQQDVKLSQKDYKRYRNISTRVLQRVIDFQEQFDEFKPNTDEKELNSGKASKQFRIRVNKLLSSTFQKIIKMRQFCCHPALYYSRSKFILFQNYKRHFDDFMTYKQTYNKRRPKKMILKKLKQQQKQEQLQLFNHRQTGEQNFIGSIIQESKRQKIKGKRKRLQQYTYRKIMNRQVLTCVKCSKNIKRRHNGVLAICLHFYCQECFKQEYRKNAVVQDRKLSKRKAFKCVESGCEQILHINQVITLPKINRFDQPLSQIKSNEKTDFVVKYALSLKKQDKLVVFTSFIGMIEILEEMLKKTSIQYETMSGEDTHEVRNAKIAKFREIPQIKVFIISLKCGCVGLNLQMANKLIFVQTWWNPAVEQQAIGRLHRMGQTKQVEVVRLITKNTIEQGMQIMGQQKKLISQFILDSDNQLSLKRQKKIHQLRLIKQILTRSVKNQYSKSSANQKMQAQKNNEISSDNPDSDCSYSQQKNDIDINMQQQVSSDSQQQSGSQSQIQQNSQSQNE